MSNIDISSFIQQQDNFLLSKLKSTFDNLDTVSLSLDFDEITKTIKDEILKKFEGSRHEEKVRAIFTSNIEVLKGYFTDCMSLVENNKTDVIKQVYTILNNHKDELLLSVDDLIKSKINENEKFKELKDNQGSPNTNVINLATMIYDDEFVKVINSLSTTMKDFFKNTKNIFNEHKLICDNLLEEIEYSKSNIQQVIHSINRTSTNISTGSNHFITSALSSVKENIHDVYKRLDKVNDITLLLNRNNLSTKNLCLKFYDDSKGLFKEMKNLRNEKMEQIEHNADKFLVNNSSLLNNSLVNNSLYKDKDSTVNLLKGLETQTNASRFTKINNFVSGNNQNKPKPSLSPDNNRYNPIINELNKQITELKGSNDRLNCELREVKSKLQRSQEEMHSLTQKNPSRNNFNNNLLKANSLKTGQNKLSSSVDKLSSSIESLKEKFNKNKNTNFNNTFTKFSASASNFQQLKESTTNKENR